MDCRCGKAGRGRNGAIVQEVFEVGPLSLSYSLIGSLHLQSLAVLQDSRCLNAFQVLAESCEISRAVCGFGTVRSQIVPEANRGQSYANDARGNLIQLVRLPIHLLPFAGPIVDHLSGNGENWTGEDSILCKFPCR